MNKRQFLADPWRKFLRNSEVPDSWWIAAISFDPVFRDKLFSTLAHDFGKSGRLSDLGHKWLARIAAAPAFLCQFYSALAQVRHVLEWNYDFLSQFGVCFLEDALSTWADADRTSFLSEINEAREHVRDYLTNQRDVEDVDLSELEDLFFVISSARRNDGPSIDPSVIRRAAELSSLVGRNLKNRVVLPRDVIRVYIDFLATNVPLGLGPDLDPSDEWKNLWSNLWVVD